MTLAVAPKKPMDRHARRAALLSKPMPQMVPQAGAPTSRM